VLLDSAFTSGSGGGGNGADMVVLIPTSQFDASFGNNVYLYSAFGFQGGEWQASSGFEEWGAQTGTTSLTVTPMINVEKLVSVDGGTTWYLSPDDSVSAESTGDIAAVRAALPGSQTLISDGSVPSATAGVTSLEFEVVVTNTENVTDTNVSVTDSPALPGPFTFSTTTLAPGTSEVSAPVTVIASATGAGLEQSDTATVTANYGTTTLTDSDTATYFDLATPDLSIVKKAVTTPLGTWPADWTTDTTSDANQVDYNGQAITYTITVTNTGNETLTNVVVSDPMDPTTDNVVGTLASLVVGASQDFTYTVNATQSQIDNGSPIVNTATVTDGQGDNKSDTAMVLIDQDPSINIEKLVSVDGGKTWYFQVVNGDSDDTASSINAAIVAAGGTALNLVAGTPATLAGASVEYRVVVTNTGNVDLSSVKVTDAPTGISFTVGGTLNVGKSELSNIVTSTAVAGTAANGYVVPDTATASGTYDVSKTISDADTAGYTGLGPTTLGLTKGYWANHSWTGIEPSASGANLILGDVNDDGKANDAPNNAAEINHSHYNDLTISNTVAMALANSSTTTDARIVMANQLVAAQLNDYNEAKSDGSHLPTGTDAAPNGLIEDAVLWLTGNDFGTGVTSTLDSAANVDQNHNGVLDLTTDYTTTEGTSNIVFTGTALSSSAAAFQTFQQVLASWTGGDGGAISANGNVLANALTAFNQGQLVTSANGSLIGWNTGSGITDVHANTPGAFWGILADQHIAGVKQA
jgi:uncharacterized repeat protein (TIGR01451 family)